MKQSGRVRGQENAPDSAVRTLDLVRVFDAPRDLVWRAWTDPAMVARWWGPRMFDTPVCELDIRPGGKIRIHMRGPDGGIYPMTGIFNEIEEPERLVFTSFALFEENGTPFLENLNTVTFEEAGAKTRVTVSITVVKATPEAEQPLAGMEQGWNEQLDKLAEELATAK